MAWYDNTNLLSDAQVSQQVSPMDELFKERIVLKEVKILAKARPARK